MYSSADYRIDVVSNRNQLIIANGIVSNRDVSGENDATSNGVTQAVSKSHRERIPSMEEGI